jgi:carbonic anhydrase/acetyltransferase-like protein (isoleucine patch superfamily)
MKLFLKKNGDWALFEGVTLDAEIEKLKITIHSSAIFGEWAIVGEGASVGEGAHVGEWAIVGKGARVGEGANVGKGARVGKEARVGKGANIATTLDCIVMGPLGSNSRMLTFYRHKDGIKASTGCFDGDIDEFTEAVKAKHGNSRIGREYLAAVDYAKSKFSLTD